MRKTTTSLIVAAGLLLGACGGDDAATTDGGGEQAEAASTDEPADDEASDDGGGNAPAGDIQAAVLTAADLPDGLDVQPFDPSIMEDLAGAAPAAEDVTFDPAECGEADFASPMTKDGVEAAGILAMTADFAESLIAVVYSAADGADLDALEDYAKDCGEFSMTGTIADQPINEVERISVADAPDVDADDVVAFDAVTESEGTSEDPMRMVYVVDGDYGVMVMTSPDSEVFDLDAITAIAIERKKEALG